MKRFQKWILFSGAALLSNLVCQGQVFQPPIPMPRPL